MHGASVVVAAHKSKNDILLGRDVMEKIPKLKEAMDLKRTAVSEMTKGIMDEIITNIEYQIVPQKKEVNIISLVIDELVLDQVLAQMMLEEPGNEINAISIGELQ